MHFLERLHKYGQQLENDFHARFMASLEFPEKENIHQLRVTIKRLRAYLQLLKAIDPDFPVIEVLEPLKNVFRAAGILRDFQIHQTLVLERTKSAQKKELLAKQFEVQETALKTSYQMQESGFSFVGLRNGFILLYDKMHIMDLEQAYRGLADYLNMKIIQILEKIVLSGMNEAELHRLRIKLKAFYYMLYFLKKEYGFKGILVARSIKTIESLQDDLGIWHDLYMATEESGELNQSAVARRRLIKERKEAYAQLLTKLANFSSFLVSLSKKIPTMIDVIRTKDSRLDSPSYSQVNLLERSK